MRMETEARLKVLQEQYWGKKEAKDVGPRIREKYKDQTYPLDSSITEMPTKTGGILKKGGNTESLAKPKFDHRNLQK